MYSYYVPAAFRVHWLQEKLIVFGAEAGGGYNLLKYLVLPVFETLKYDFTSYTNRAVWPPALSYFSRVLWFPAGVDDTCPI